MKEIRQSHFVLGYDKNVMQVTQEPPNQIEQKWLIEKKDFDRSTASGQNFKINEGS